LYSIVSIFVSFVTLTILTAVNTRQKFANPSIGHVMIVMILLFGVFYKMPGIIVLIYTAEITPYNLCAKAFVITGFRDMLANLFSGYTNPIALAAIR
jgi:uncharacterized membrane protein